MKKHHLVLGVSVLLIAFFVVSTNLYNTNKSGQINEAAFENKSILVRDYSPTMGAKDAKVTIVEFFDPACETCKAFYPFVKKLMAANPGKINLVLRYTPLHRGSDYVIKILESARLQNKFWQTLEATYDAQPMWAAHHNPQPERLWMLLGNVGLDLTKAKSDMQSSTIADRINQDMADAQKLQVTKTPGFFVNGKPLVQFGYEQLRELVEAEIRNNY